jgi:hypothetical protein
MQILKKKVPCFQVPATPKMGVCAFVHHYFVCVDSGHAIAWKVPFAAAHR